MKKIIVFIIFILLLCGCSTTKCIESHEEESTCTYTSCYPIGKTLMCVPHSYSCTKTICDEWGEE